MDKRAWLSIVGGASLLSLLAGTGSGYLYAKRKLTAEYNEQMEREIERTRQHLAKMHKTDEFATPETALQHLSDKAQETRDAGEEKAAEVLDDAVKALTSYRGNVDPEPTLPVIDITKLRQRSVEDAEPITRNIWKEQQRPADTPIYREVEQEQDTGEIRVITQEAYFQNDPEHEQARLTYFEGDNVLADVRDEVIPDHEVPLTIGEGNLLFGHLSGEDHIVYIRNPRLKTDFEVARSGGKYSVEVAGYEEAPTQEPMRAPGVGRFRG